MRPRTDTQTDTQTRVITIHFSWSTTHAKCSSNNALHDRFQLARMTEVGGRLETPSSVYTKSAFMDIQASQGQGQQHHSGSGSPDGVAAGGGFGSSTLGTAASSYHHPVRPSPPPVAGYRHHMHGPSPHQPHQQSQIDVPACFMSSNPSVQVTLTTVTLFYSF